MSWIALTSDRLARNDGHIWHPVIHGSPRQYRLRAAFHHSLRLAGRAHTPLVVGSLVVVLSGVPAKEEEIRPREDEKEDVHGTGEGVEECDDEGRDGGECLFAPCLKAEVDPTDNRQREDDEGIREWIPINEERLVSGSAERQRNAR